MDKYFHSVILDEKLCMGCTNCMQRCPMEAIRVKDRKAIIDKERCIDCGECIRACPYHAQKSFTDKIDVISDFKYKVALVPITMYGQFKEGTRIDKIFEAIKKLGFDYVYDESVFADLASIMVKEELKNKNIDGPLISSHCPAVIRLIQARFPDLIENLITVESTVEIGGRMIRRELKESLECEDSDIGIVYISPCTARVTSVKRPLGIWNSALDGSVSFKDIYGDIMRNLKSIEKYDSYRKGNLEGIRWSFLGGQSESIESEKYVAVDGIFNVIDVLEALEMGKLEKMRYIEASACVGGCVGGALNIENPYIAIGRLKHLEVINHGNLKYNEAEVLRMLRSGFMHWDKEIVPVEVIPLDDDLLIAMKKIEELDRIVRLLPGLDCGSCGAPSCRAFAEDIVRGFAKIDDCKFR